AGCGFCISRIGADICAALRDRFDLGDLIHLTITRFILVFLAIFLMMGCVGIVGATTDELIKPDNITLEISPDPITTSTVVIFTFSADNATSFYIDFGDNSNESGVDTKITHTYNAVGDYPVKLTAKNDTESTDVEKSITVVPEPIVASFTADPTSGTAPLDVQFTDTSSGTPTSWKWDFDDGDSSTNQNPPHTFATNGTYVVNLTVYKDGVDSNTSSRTIIVNPAPTTTNISSVVLITGVTPPVYGAIPVSTASSDTEGISNVTVSWNSNPTKFAAETQYTATIVVNATSEYVFNITKPTVSLDGSTMSESNVTRDSDTKITITYTFPKTAAKVNPSALLSLNVSSGTVPLTVKFSYTLSNYDNCTLIYGDGASSYLTSSSGDITHTYTTAGSYTASIIAKNVNGTTYNNKSITVNKIGLNAAFTASAGSGTAPLTIRFTDTSAGSPTTWLWDFGGLGSSTLKNPSYTFTTAGNYIVKLIVIDSSGATDTYSKVITVNALVATSTHTPTPTETVSSLSMSFGTGNINPLILSPVDIIKEFVQLFHIIIDMENYVGASNQTNMT
ncbi:MAG TPA: PKD domain-containing protein, partial [Methanocorpusculum sp.]|nr:PKD domain-containing protein [Methanocorpusculum sp.]